MFSPLILFVPDYITINRITTLINQDKYLRIFWSGSTISDRKNKIEKFRSKISIAALTGSKLKKFIEHILMIENKICWPIIVYLLRLPFLPSMSFPFPSSGSFLARLPSPDVKTSSHNGRRGPSKPSRIVWVNYFPIGPSLD